MKIIPKEEFTGPLPGKPGKDSPLRAMLLQLRPGDVLEIEKSEWTKAKPPYHIIAHLKKKLKRTFEYCRKLDGNGWMFRRLT